VCDAIVVKGLYLHANLCNKMACEESFQESHIYHLAAPAVQVPSDPVAVVSRGRKEVGSWPMAHQIKDGNSQRKHVRVRGPFDAYHLGDPQTPVLVYDLNVGGGFVNFADAQPETATLTLKIDLPDEGPISVNAETVYRHQFGVAVRFVDVDSHTTERLQRTVNALKHRQAESW
jgi:hypothetical protein